MQGDVEEIVKKNMEKAMKNYNNETNKGVKETWDLLQKDVKCCGTEEYKDWSSVTGFGENQVPDSCCKVRSNTYLHTVGQKNKKKSRPKKNNREIK